jgi:hypothetical protein
MRNSSSTECSVLELIRKVSTARRMNRFELTDELIAPRKL